VTRRALALTLTWFIVWTRTAFPFTAPERRARTRALPPAGTATAWFVLYVRWLEPLPLLAPARAGTPACFHFLVYRPPFITACVCMQHAIFWSAVILFCRQTTSTPHYATANDMLLTDAVGSSSMTFRHAAPACAANLFVAAAAATAFTTNGSFQQRCLQRSRGAHAESGEGRMRAYAMPCAAPRLPGLACRASRKR